jgi:hypothetical protein
MKPTLHPWNAALRFLLELTALFALGRWGHAISGGYVLALALPLLAASAWGVFTVPGDPSRGKDGPVRVSGVVRLLLEAAFFAAGACGLAQTGHARLATAFAASVCLHYALAHARTRWLLAQR